MSLFLLDFKTIKPYEPVGEGESMEARKELRGTAKDNRYLTSSNNMSPNASN